MHEVVIGETPCKLSLKPLYTKYYLFERFKKMTPAGQLQFVMQLYDLCVASPYPADHVMHGFFRDRTYMGSADRRFVAEGLYSLFRHKARLTWHAQHMGAIVTSGRILSLVHAALVDKLPFGQITQLCDGEKYHPKKLADDETSFYKKLEKTHLHHHDMPEAVQAECPPALYKTLKNFYGDQFLPYMQALQTQATLDLRVNTLKTTRDNLLEFFKSAGLPVEATKLSPVGLRANHRLPFSNHPLFQKGHFDVQDEGAQILALCCGAKPGDWVVDFCAGAGGKTLMLAAQMQNKGRIWACDNDARRLQNGKLRYRKAGLSLVEMVDLPDENANWVKKHAKKADIVLLDVPCSGTGTWRRHPFARWQNIGPNLDELTALQHSILHSAARLVKPHGFLIYATCSLLPEENEQQLSNFLYKNPEFKPVPLASLWARAGTAVPNGLDLSSHQLRLHPKTHSTDAFFVAALQRGEAA
jgi:16S rRNA (cytosine967-C5)-methyltransferase